MSHSQHAGEDLRTVRTREAIQRALIELTIKKGFSAVTVSDIAAHARVNRATFYRHYQDKFDVIDQYAQEVYALLDAPAEEGSRSNPELAGLIQMFEHIRSNATFFRVMLGEKGDPSFAERIRQHVEKRMRQSLPPVLVQDRSSTDLFLSYVSSGSVGVVRWWLEHDMPYSPAEMAAVACRLTAADVGALGGRT